MPLPSREVIVFPGQGAYRSDALAALAARTSAVRTIFDEIDDVVAGLGGRPVSPLLLGPQPPDIGTLADEAPDVLQLALYGTSYAAFTFLQEQGIRSDVIVGHSFGEIAALVAGGAYTVRQGAEIVAHRNHVLSRIAPGTGGMLALGCDVDRAELLVAALSDPFSVVAVENGDRQTVLSGSREAIDALAVMAKAARLTAMPLKAPWPFHSPLLATLVDDFRQRIAHLPTAPLRVPVFSPTLGRYHRPHDDLASHLARCFVARVRFKTAIQRVADGATPTFHESGASDALAGAIRRVLPSARAVSLLDLLAEGPVPARSAPATSVTPTAPVTPATPAGAPMAPATREELFAELVTMYAEALEYPAEVFTETVALEADLGIDSVKQTELLARAADRYGLPAERPDGFRLSDHDTMGRLVDYVWSMRAGQPTAGPGPEPVPHVSSDAVAPSEAPTSREHLFAELVAMYAEALEYPAEVFTETVALEADLGIDSVKQTELLARAADRYGLPAERPDGFRLSDHDTMGRLVDYVWSQRRPRSATNHDSVRTAAA